MFDSFFLSVFLNNTKNCREINWTKDPPENDQVYVYQSNPSGRNRLHGNTKKTRTQRQKSLACRIITELFYDITALTITVDFRINSNFPIKYNRV